MDATTLRQAQAPVKQRYREAPASARTPTSAHGDFRGEGVTATIEGWAGPIRAGLHPATGGTGEDACSADLLLQALLACAGVTLRAVATSMEVEIRSAQLSAEGWWDARGTLGVDRSAPIGVQEIAVTIAVDTPADDATLDRLARATERYCVVGQSLAAPPTFSVIRLT